MKKNHTMSTMMIRTDDHEITWHDPSTTIALHEVG
jgi:hypothetical protein